MIRYLELGLLMIILLTIMVWLDNKLNTVRIYRSAKNPRPNVRPKGQKDCIVPNVVPPPVPMTAFEKAINAHIEHFMGTDVIPPPPPPARKVREDKRPPKWEK